MARQPRQGEVAWSQTEKINAELFAFTYGSLVVKLIKELESLSKVNSTLDEMGYNIGMRLIDDFLSKNEVNCDKLSDTAEIIAKVSRNLGAPMTGIGMDNIQERFAERGW